MLPTTILVDEAPRCVVRPNDVKDLNRFIRNGKTFLLAENSPARLPIAVRMKQKWRNGKWPGAAQGVGRRG